MNLRFFLYRPLQRLMHRFHLHHTRVMGPLMPGGGYVEKCEWCGLSRSWGRAGDVPGGSSSPLTPGAGDATQAAKDGAPGTPSDSRPPLNLLGRSEDTP
jgi:hypothetical protein